METSITLKPSEINEHLLKVLQNFFNGKENYEITINVKEKSEPAFLLNDSSEVYFNKLDKAIDNVENNRNLVSFTFEEFEKFSKSLMS